MTPTGKSRNPPWSREELILALALYVNNPKSRTSAKIIGESKLPQELNKLRKFTLRNANSVYQKMQNFYRFDPACIAQGKPGRPKGNHLEKGVWDEFYNKPEALGKICQSIRAKIGKDTLRSSDEIEDQRICALEGQLTEQQGYRRKRDLRLRQAVLNISRGVCAVCDTDYSKVLNGRGVRVLQVHHKRQLSQLEMPQINSQDDLAVVCTNCHTLIHIDPKKALTIKLLRLMLSKST